MLQWLVGAPPETVYAKMGTIHPVDVEDYGAGIVKFKNGASILKKGAPDLPRYSRSIIIPDDAHMEIEILSSQFGEIDEASWTPAVIDSCRLAPEDQ